ncbi:MAG: HD domain-containing protein [Deltaproteobacteria bacterium]|nr:HD domain-containing protein [Deltaproteobacteria bacterium]
MDDKFKITEGLKVDPDNLESARSFDSDLQVQGRSLVNALHMLVRNVKLYGPENEIFNKPMGKIRDSINTIIAMEGQISLQSAGDSFYLNNMLLKFDLKSLENLQYLHQEFERCDVGGFLLEKQITVHELQNFIYIFSRDNTEAPGEQGVSTRKLMALKLRKFEKIKEILQQQEEEGLDAADAHSQAKLDRKRYGLVVYARAVHFMRKYLDGLRGEGPEVPSSKATHLVQDLVDVAYEQSSHFLGMATEANNENYLAYHSVSVTMLAIIFGVTLEFSKEQLRDVATAALFHDIGKAELDGSLLKKMDKLTPFESLQLSRSATRAVTQFLRSKFLNRTTINNVIVAYNHATEYGKALKELNGNILVERVADLSVYTKIVAIVDAYEDLTSRFQYSPHVAFALMNSDIKHKFDPDYLRIFGRILKGLSQKVISERGEKVSIF